MPEFLGDTVVVTKEELIPRFWNTYEALAQKLYRDSKVDYGIKRFMYGGNNRRLYVKFDTLPAEVKEQLGDPRTPEHILEDYYTVDIDAVDFYDTYQYPDGSYLKPETIENLIINASVLSALVKLQGARERARIATGISLRGVTKSLFEDSISFNKVLRKNGNTPEEQKLAEHTLNTNYRRFKEKLKEYKADSYISLIKDAKGVTKKNAQKRDEKTERLLNNLFAGQLPKKPNATRTAREYQAFLDGYADIVNDNVVDLNSGEITGELYNPKDFPKLSLGAITNYLRLYESRVGNEAKRSGDRQVFNQKNVPYETLEQPMFAGSMISIDDRQPPFWYEKGTRMWWYLGIDLASECITAWAYGKTKEELIINFYRQLVRNYAQWGVNLPDALECESSLNSSFKNTFLRDGSMFNNVQIHPNSARSKRIEGYFKPLRYEIEKEQEGWIARPFAKSESNQASTIPNKIIPYEKLVQQCMSNIVTWNNMANKQDKSISRFDYFMQRQHPDLRDTNWKGFIKHLGYEVKTSCKAGFMHLQGSPHWVLGDNGEVYTGEKLISLLKKVEGKDIRIFWLDDNKGDVMKALVYDKKEDRYICEAIPKPVSARAPIEAKNHHKEAREIMSRYRNTVTEYIKFQKNAIESVTVINNKPQTISSSFSMPGIESFTPRTTEAEKLENHRDDSFEYAPQEAKKSNGLRDAFFK